MSKKKDNSEYSVSGVSEFSALTRIMTIAFIVATIASLALYIWMAIPPVKVNRLDDQAGIFSEEERDELLSQMKDIRKEKGINVMVVTVADKGSEYKRQDESDTIRYAEDRFKELSEFKKLRDNSGVLVLIELDGEYRTFYIVTFGTARASITDSECTRISEGQVYLLTTGEYQQAVRGALDKISEHNFTSGLLILTYASFIIVPILIVIPIIRLVARRKRYQITVDESTYLDPDAENTITRTDIYDGDASAQVSYVEEENTAEGWQVFFIILRILLMFAGGGGGRGGSRGGGSRGGGGRFGGGGMRF